MKLLIENKNVVIFKKGNKLINELKSAMVSYLEKKGYDDASDYVVIELSNHTNFQGDKMIKVEIRNDLVKFYNEDKLIQILDKIISKYNKDSYFEPEYSTVWNAYLYDMQLEENLSEDIKDYDKDYVDDIRATAELLKRTNASNIRLENGVIKIPIYGKEYFIFLKSIDSDDLVNAMASSDKKRG